VAQAATEIIGTQTPHAATSGAMMIEVLSPTPPVECLSAFGLGMSEKSRNVAGVEHGLGQSLLLGVVHAVQVDGHEQRADLIVGNAAAGDACDEEVDLFTR
jgi:hypothetical protein